jgi:hypothetical protein
VAKHCQRTAAEGFNLQSFHENEPELSFNSVREEKWLKNQLKDNLIIQHSRKIPTHLPSFCLNCI